MYQEKSDQFDLNRGFKLQQEGRKMMETGKGLKARKNIFCRIGGEVLLFRGYCIAETGRLAAGNRLLDTKIY